MVAEMAVEFRLLGDVEARVGGRMVDLGHVRQRSVLAVLLVDANRAVSVDQLLDRVWEGRRPQRARDALYSYLSRLRRALSAGGVGIVRQPGGYLLEVDPVAVDLHRFDGLVGQARGAAAADAADLLAAALALWRGEPFAGMDTPWFTTVRAALDRRRLAAELDRNDLALACGGQAALVGDLHSMAAGHPLDERLAGQLMLALYRCGRQAGALVHYEGLRSRLAEELGTDPGPALRRLHVRILNADPALTVEPVAAASSPAGVVSQRSPDPAVPLPRQLPGPQPAFVGRVRQLTELSRSAGACPGTRDTLVTWAICGPGGMGKTWLALRWAHENIERFPGGQLYVDLRGFDPASKPMPPDEAVLLFLGALGIAPAAVPAGLDARSALYRSLVAGRRMLVVLDNARDTAQVAPLLPGTAACTVLVTSRNRLAGLVTAHGARPLTLDVLSAAEARDLLGHHLGARLAAEPGAVAALVDHCAGLPLALGVVAVRATLHPGFPLETLAAELGAVTSRLDALDAGEMAASVRAVLATSHGAVTPDAARVFGLLGLAPGPDVGLPAAASLTGLPTARVRVLLRELTATHLVQEHVPGRYRMHDLVRLYATELAERLDRPSRDAALRRVLDHYLHTAHAAATRLQPGDRRTPLTAPGAGVVPECLADHDAALEWFTSEHAVLVAAVDRARTGFAAHTWQLASCLGLFLSRRGHWHDWSTTQYAALVAARRLGDRDAQARTCRSLALAQVALGRFEEAPVHLRHALDLFTALGDDIGRADTHRSLARVSARQGRFGEALPHAHRALELYRAAGHRIGQASALNAVGWFLANLGEDRRALAYCQRAIAEHEQLDDRAGQACAWDSLGFAHHRLGGYRVAVSCFERAIALFRELATSYAEAEVLIHLGDTHQVAGDPEAAREGWLRAWTLLDGLGHPDAERARDRLDRLGGVRAGAPIALRPAGSRFAEGVDRVEPAA